MSLTALAIVLTLLNTLLITSLYGVLYAKYREKFLVIWVLNGAFTSLGYIFLLFTGLGDDPGPGDGIYMIFVLFTMALVYWGAVEFFHKPFPRLVGFGMLAGMAWGILAEVFRFSFILTTLPVCTLTLLFYGALGVQFLGQAHRSEKRKANAGKYIVGGALIALGVHQFDYPFVGHLSSFTAWGHLIISILTSLLAFGIVLIFFERVQDQLQEQQKALLEAKTAAEAANRVKSIFLANMSHELRTPLNSVTGFSQTLLDGLHGALTGDQREAVQVIHDSGWYLLELIDDILDLTRIETSDLELSLESTDLAAVVQQVEESIRPEARKKGIDFQVNLPAEIPRIQTDARRIRHVLFHLLNNALKFTDKGGKIGLDASTSSKELQVVVWDTGKGIPTSQLNQLFQPFDQLETELAKKAPGMGLGLYLCDRYVRLHGGEIWVESTPGTGSRFFFTLPITLKKQ